MYDENVEMEATSKCFIVNYNKGSDIGSSEDMKLLELMDSYTKVLSYVMKICIDTSCTLNDSCTNPY